MYKVTVIIPVYNVEKYIERCARSLFEQTLDNIEYIFVDDCSSDNSVKILQQVTKDYPSREVDIKVLHHSHNKGSAAARNTGINAAQGKYIIHCDSDDWVNQKMYELMYEQAIKLNTDIVICDYNEVYHNKKNPQKINPPAISKQCTMQILNGQMHGSLCNKLVKRELYTKYDIQCIEGADFCEDLYITSRLFFNAKTISYINKPLYNYCIHNRGSYTTRPLSKKNQQGLISICKELSTYFENDQLMSQPMINFKNAIKADLILRGDFRLAKEIEGTGNLKSIIKHPTLPLKHKILIVFNDIGFMYGLKLFRMVYKLKRRFKA